MNQLNEKLNRRKFCASGMGGLLMTQAALSGATSSTVQFGIIADIHHSLMPGAQGRLEAFLDESSRRSPAFLIQLGDFCHGFSASPNADQKQFLKTWHQVRTPKYSVLGNHEMDHSDKRSIMELLEMSRSHYSFDHGGFHFVVLDCMHIKDGGKMVDYVDGNYFHRTPDKINWVNQEQLEWLDADLRATPRPTVVFTHPCINRFWAKGAEETRANVQAVFEKANADAGRAKVIACFSGHHHVDHHSERSGVHYFLMNSASYYWVGEAYGSLAKYRDPLFTFVTLDPRGSLMIEGKNSVFIPPTPTDLHHPDAPNVTPSIEARKVHFEVSPKV